MPVTSATLTVAVPAVIGLCTWKEKLLLGATIWTPAKLLSASVLPMVPRVVETVYNTPGAGTSDIEVSKGRAVGGQ